MDKYKIAEGSSIDELVISVNELVDEGYRPYGEVGHILGKYLQAMFVDPECAPSSVAKSPRVKYHNGPVIYGDW
jgi:hypothetical protein